MEIVDYVPGYRTPAGTGCAMGMVRWRTGRIAVDIGGTFTDAVWLDGGELRTAKVPSIPQRQDDSVLAAVERLGAPLDGVGDFIHGTTAATERAARAPRRAARDARPPRASATSTRSAARTARDVRHPLARPPMLLAPPRHRRARRAPRRRRLGAEALDEPPCARSARGWPANTTRSPSACCTRTPTRRTSSAWPSSCARRRRPRRRLLARGGARVARVRALVVHGRLGVRDAGDRRLPLAPRRAAGGAGAARPLRVMQSNGGVTSASLVVRRAAKRSSRDRSAARSPRSRSRATSAPGG